MKSDIECFIEAEYSFLAKDFAPYKQLALSFDVFDQALLGGWVELMAAVKAFLWKSDDELVEFYRDQADGYRPFEPDSHRNLAVSYFTAAVVGVVDDLENDEVSLDSAYQSSAELHEVVRRHGQSSQPLYGSRFVHEVLDDAYTYEFEMESIAALVGCVIPWQRLAWLSECKLRKGAVLASGRGTALLGEKADQLTYLMRLAENQPGLGNWPELASFVPRYSSSLMPLSKKSYLRFRRDGISSDVDLCNRLVDEIVNHRHYVLDSISIVELDELGVRRIVMAPEERPQVRTMVGSIPEVHTAFIVDHSEGSFFGHITLGDSDGPRLANHRATVMLPALMRHMAHESEGHGNSEDPVAEAVHEAQAAVETLILSTWRDLVVPRVRDEHYETERTRRRKGTGRKGAARGNVDVVRYLPRRLVYRRAVEASVSEGGRRRLTKVFPVSAFTRRLPDGQRRSREAELFARESGVPLAEHQTIVRPHFRGGTEEDRLAALESREGLQVRRWRSWSALDLLRTRSLEVPKQID